jgi:hypothetical protein
VNPEDPEAAAWDEGEPTDAASTDLASAHECEVAEWDEYELAGKSLEQIVFALDKYIRGSEAIGMSEQQATEDALWFEHDGARYTIKGLDILRNPEISESRREQLFKSAQAIAQRLLEDDSGFIFPEPIVLQ